MRTSVGSLGKMANTNPLDEILNSNVDPNDFRAVYGNLQSQLASPTNRAHTNSNYTTIPSLSNSGATFITSQQTFTNINSVPNSVYSAISGTVNATSVNGGRNLHENSNMNHLNVLTTSVNPQRVFKTDTNSVIYSSQLHQVPGIGVKTDSNQLNIQRIAQSTVAGITPQTNLPNSNLFTIANVTQDNKHIAFSNAGDMKAVSLNDCKQQTMFNVVNQSNVVRPQYVIKQEVKHEINTETHQVLQQGQIRLMANSNQQIPNTLNVVHSQPNVIRTPFTSNSASVVMTKPIATPQTVTVMRPAISTTFSNSQNTMAMNSPRIAVNPGMTRVAAPRPAGTAGPIRIAPSGLQPVRTPGGTIALPPGVTLPPGAVLMKNSEGQLVVVQGSAANQRIQQVRPGMAVSAPNQVASVRPASFPQVSLQQQQQQLGRPNPPAFAQPPVAQPQTIQSAVSQPQQQQQQQQPKESIVDSMKKCKNFLQTLIKLASGSSNQAATVDQVKNLIQLLIDAKVEPEEFTEKLQAILNSSPQPYLVPFLKRSLPMLRLYMFQNKTKIDGIRAPPIDVIQRHTLPGLAHPNQQQQRPQPAQSPVPNKPQTPANVRTMTPEQVQKFVQQTKMLQQKQQQLQQHQGINAKSPVIKPPGSTLQQKKTSSNLSASSNVPKEATKRKYDSSSIKDDDDINDVAAMGGVNLSEESRNIMASTELLSSQLRSCKDECFLASQPLMTRINLIARKHGLEDCSTEIANLISHATQERIKNLLARLSVIAEHRLEIYKNDSRFEQTSEPRLQIKFLEEVEQLEEKRHSEAERETLLRAAKSRSKNEDPEHLKLREKAKQMQQLELEEARHRETNEAALLAIGPRKKRKTEDTSSTSDGLGSRSNVASLRQRIKRVNLRDLTFLLEQERESNKSTVLYKSFLK